MFFKVTLIKLIIIKLTRIKFNCTLPQLGNLSGARMINHFFFFFWLWTVSWTVEQFERTRFVEGKYLILLIEHPWIEHKPICLTAFIFFINMDIKIIGNYNFFWNAHGIEIQETLCLLQNDFKCVALPTCFFINKFCFLICLVYLKCSHSNTNTFAR